MKTMMMLVMYELVAFKMFRAPLSAQNTKNDALDSKVKGLKMT